MNVFALDFDGVLCDSVAEAAITAWRAGRKLWPHWRGEEPADRYRLRFISLWPLVETGYQAILLMDLIHEGLSTEIIAAHFAELYERRLQQIELSREQLAQLFSQTRDEWIARDGLDWFSRHRFYSPVMARFAERVQSDTFFILTTKQERFVRRLLEGCGIGFPAERLLGLDRGKKKEELLEKLLERSEWQNATWHFIEDRLATLLRVAARDSLRRVRLYLAGWGYNTVADQVVARQHPAITLWRAEQFLVV